MKMSPMDGPLIVNGGRGVGLGWRNRVDAFN